MISFLILRIPQYLLFLFSIYCLLACIPSGSKWCQNSWHKERSSAKTIGIPLLLLLSRLSCVRLCATLEMAAHQAPPPLGFSRQEHWSGLPFPSPMHESEKWKWSHSVLSNSWRPHGLQPTRLLRPWGFLGKSTGVGFRCLLWNTSTLF